MKVLLILAAGVLAVLLLTSACEFEVNTVSGPAQTSKKGITDVAGLLEQATKAGDPPKPGSAAARLNTECARREQRLARLPRPTKLTDIAPHAQRVLAVLKAHDRRAARLGASPQVRAINASSSERSYASQGPLAPGTIEPPRPRRRRSGSSPGERTPS